jgi:hypothetical protein
MRPDAFDAAWLEDALRELAETDSLKQTPPRVEQSLRAAFKAHSGRGRRGARQAGWWLAAAAAALAVWGAIRGAAPDTPATADDAAFLPLVEGEPFAELDAVQVMRVRLPRSALARLGGSPVAAETGSVDAQVILGQDGVARAIRFVE